MGGPGVAWRGLSAISAERRHRPKAPHYFLYAIGIAPPFQGLGLGGGHLSYLVTAKAVVLGVSVHYMDREPV